MNFEIDAFRDFAEFACAHYVHVLSISLTHNLLTISLVDFCDFCNVLCPAVGRLFAQFSESNFHFIRLKYNYNFVNNRNESVPSQNLGTFVQCLYWLK